MAKILDKDPVVYNRERDVFMRDLQHFHDTRGTKFRRPPAISGHEIDLYLLYNIVTAKGGWVKVTSRNEWDGMLEHFGLPTQCVNSGVALKQIYIRFLDRYEKVHYLGEEADRGSDDDEESRHKRWSARAMHSVPLTYNHHQHNVTEANRSYNGLSADLYKSSDYDKLMLSLLSPLPNEQDYAINVCTLLSNEGKHVLKLEKCPKIVDYLLAHAGVFNHSSLRPVFLETYNKVRRQPLSSFWYDTLENHQFTDLMVESKFTKRKTILPVVGPIKKEKSTVFSRREALKLERKDERDAKVPKSDDTDKETKTNKSEPETVPEKPQKDSDSAVTQESKNVDCVTTDVNASTENDVTERLCETEESTVDETDEDSTAHIVDPTPSDEYDDSNLFAPSGNESRRGKQKVKLKISQSDNELFCLGRTLGTQDYIGQRVLQIADILRNLSFTDENVSVLANNISFLRFSLLCTSSRWNTLHQYGFDMLSNVATEVLVKDPIRDKLTECLLLTITQGLTSADRFVIISCLDVLNKLSQNEANEDVLLRYLEQNVYEQVCLFLTIQDIMLLVYTLECLYSLSSLGERACNSIIKVHGVIDVLVALITVEAQSYGPKACIGMKVIETVPQGGVLTPTTSQTTIPTTPISSSSGTTTMTSLSNVTVSSINSPVFSTPSLVSIATPITRNTPSIVAPTARIVQNTYTPITPQPTITVPQPPVQLTQTVQQIQHQLTANSPNQNVQQQHAHQQAVQENEHFAQAWLRANFEPDVKSRVEQQELYRNYLNSCSKMGRKGVIAPLHFPRIVRCVFGGTVGPNPTKFDNLLYYEGIKIRPTPLVNTYTPPTQVTNTQPQPRPATPIKTNRRTKTPTMQVSVPSSTPDSTANDIMVTTPPPSPASPILKAQLSAPSKIKESPVKIDTNKCQASAHPHLSQALLGSNIPTPVVSNAQKETSAATIATATSAVSTPSTSSSSSCSSVGNQQQSSSSLIKSLLATKVNDCMPVISMTPASVVTMPECSVPATVVPQVAQRQQQQRLLSQQLQSQPSQQLSSPQPVIQVNKNVKSQKQAKNDSAKMARVNGARTPIQENELLESLVTSTVQGALVDNRASVQNSVQRGRNTQAPPPLAPLSTSTVARQSKTNKIESEDSDSTGNNSVASSSGLGTIQSNAISDNVSSTEDGENSLTSFEGLLLNGIQNSIDIDAPCVDDNATNIPIVKPKSQSLMLADLLEKKIEKKEPPLMNGVIGKELRIGEKGLELVENHIERVLMSKSDNSKIVSPTSADETKVSVIVSSDTVELTATTDNLANNGDNVLCNKVNNDEIMEHDGPVMPTTLKRPAEEPGDVQVKRPNNSSVIVTNTSINGTTTVEEMPKETSTLVTMTVEGDDNEGGSVSSTAANLYAALAADVLDEEDLDEETPVQQETPVTTPSIPLGIQQNNLTLTPASPVPVQVPMSVQQTQQQQLIVHSNNRPIIVTQAQIANTGPMLFTAGGQILQQQPTAVATMKTGPQGMPVLVQTGSGSPSMQQQRVMLSQMHQGMQFVASGSQPGQYVLSSGTGAGQTTYVMAQPQTALVQGQAQTVLVAQTSQQQGAKTIIILQPQTATAQATHHQKVVMTPQGQQVVVTQVSRPMLQSPTVGNAMSSALVSTANQVQQSIATAVTSMTTTSIVQNVQNLQNCATVVTPPTQSTLSKIVTSNAAVTTNNNSISKVIVESTNGAVNRDINAATQQMLNSNLSANAKMAKLTNANARPQQPFTVQRTTVLDYPFICEWKGCTSKTSFKSANEVLLHACDAHCPTGSEEIQCLWERCDNMKRKRFSLMTHLIDRHCNTEAMKASATRRKQMSQMGRADLPTPNPPAPHPGYAPDAAFHAIKRHALEFVNPKELMDDNEGPVTKSIRLTSSLILRNLVIYSNNSRRYLRHYEPHLASVALSNVESSRTIAQVLYDLNDSGSRR